MKVPLIKRLHSAIHKAYHSQELYERIPRRNLFVYLSIILLCFTCNFFILFHQAENLYKDDGVHLKNLALLSEIVISPEGTLQTLYNITKQFIDTHMVKEYRNLGYLSTLVPIFSYSLDVLTRISYWNYVLGILLIVSVYLVGERLFSQKIALIAAFLISVNPNILERTVQIAPENMLVLLSLWGLYFFVRGLDKYRFLFLGVFLGVCAGITKLNGFMLPVSIVITLCCLCFVPELRSRERFVFCALAATALVGVVVWYETLYTVFYKEIVGVIQESMYNPENVVWDISELEGMSIIAAKKITVPYILYQCVMGFLKTAHRYAVSFLTSFEVYTQKLYIGNLGYFIVPVYFYLLCFEKDLRRRLFYLCFSAVMYIAVVPRNMIGHGTARYTIMIAPLAYYFMAPLLLQLLLYMQRIQKLSSRWIFPSTTKTLILLGTFLICIQIYMHPNILRHFSLKKSFPEEYKSALEWIKTHSSMRSNIALSSTSRLSYMWYTQKLFYYKEKSCSITYNGKDIADEVMITILQKHNIRFILVDANYSYSWDNPEDHRYFFRSHIHKTGKSLKIKILPPEISIKAQFPRKEPKILILGWRHDKETEPSSG